MSTRTLCLTVSVPHTIPAAAVEQPAVTIVTLLSTQQSLLLTAPAAAAKQRVLDSNRNGVRGRAAFLRCIRSVES